ncbi:hypothetical protein ILUMI_12851 [Ignelater luminosus]|uniref:Uncharacterized protein n=1 Tax=Ignelater luminosus TaxID=2038154 RepID=A0A8K0G969_IGNLU|nr:hypothetical protein ILUMI_12851 [Ignelater luminosus]
MSLIFRQALRYIGCFVRWESKPVNHSAVPLKTGGPSSGNLVGRSGVHTTVANKQTLQKLASNPCKGIPKPTDISTRYLKEEVSSLLSAITSSGIDAAVKDNQNSKSWYCKKALKSIQNGNGFLKKEGVSSSSIQNTVQTQQTFSCFEASSDKTIQSLRKDASLLGYCTGAFNVRSTTGCNQISRCYSSYNCKEIRQKDPCEQTPPPRKANVGCLVGPSGTYPVMEVLRNQNVRNFESMTICEKELRSIHGVVERIRHSFTIHI